MLVDDITIYIKAGNGGRGAVAFQKNKMALGPTGARGGNGANVYLEGVADLGALRQFRNKKDFLAPNGEQGKSQFNDGHKGDDLTLRIPVGTVIHNLTTKTQSELIKIGERLLVARGGFGGKGNFHFRSPTNRSPKEFQPGLPGEAFDVRLELKLIADVGFVGLPNIGKSSLINVLTNAQSKVANYQFTTLEPSLGAYYDLILADIPGLIEGASTGKGLGIKFLRHVERTRTLFHFIAADSDHPAADYKTIRKELGTYNKALLKKEEYIIISRSDMRSPAEVKKIVALFKRLKKTVIALSIYDDESLKELKKTLALLNKAKHI
ncbi:MAG: GTPase ObgE [Patescibacteria group bacterium]